jgi:hypothetical protein
MRRFDKNNNIKKANLLSEQRYLQSKGLISENSDIDISLLKNLTIDYPNLVKYYPNSSSGLEHTFTINGDESLSDVNGVLLPWYQIGLNNNDSLWYIEKHTYTPGGRNLDKTTHKFDKNNIKDVYLAVNRILKFIINKSKK